MSNFPKKIRINGQFWKVKSGGRTTKLLESDNLFGRALFCVKEIQIRKNIQEETKKETILHEIIHIIIANSGNNKTILKNRDDEEAITEAISNGLYQVLRENDVQLWIR